MKYALVICELQPNKALKGGAKPHDFAEHVNTLLPPNKEVSCIGLGVYLCDLSHGLGNCYTIENNCSTRGVKTRTLFFEHLPQWVESNPSFV